MAAEATPLTLLYQDAWCVAVHKPAGILVHRSPLSRDETFLLQRLRDQLGRHVYPVHRLDRATSGVLLFALDPDSASRLGQDVEAHRTLREYLAVARGWLEPEGLIDHPLDDPESGRGPRPARTHFHTLARTQIPFAIDRYPESRYSLVRLHLETGRRHQIRRHLKHIQHHLIGDTSYGKGSHNRWFREEFGVQRLWLQAARLTFRHPRTDRPITLEAAPEPDWQRLRWRLFPE